MKGCKGNGMGCVWGLGIVWVEGIGYESGSNGRFLVGVKIKGDRVRLIWNDVEWNKVDGDDKEV